MIYRLYPQEKQTKIFMGKYSRSEIPYLPVKKMRKMYPDGGFVVIGEIGNFARSPSGQDMLLICDGAQAPIFPRGCVRRPFEWIVGYAAVEEDTYVAVVHNPFSAFLRNRKRKRTEHGAVSIHTYL